MEVQSQTAAVVHQHTQLLPLEDKQSLSQITTNKRVAIFVAFLTSWLLFNILSTSVFIHPDTQHSNLPLSGHMFQKSRPITALRPSSHQQQRLRRHHSGSSLSSKFSVFVLCCIFISKRHFSNSDSQLVASNLPSLSVFSLHTILLSLQHRHEQKLPREKL